MSRKVEYVIYCIGLQPYNILRKTTFSYDNPPDSVYRDRIDDSKEIEIGINQFNGKLVNKKLVFDQRENAKAFVDWLIANDVMEALAR